jgi:hypothetical protein
VVLQSYRVREQLRGIDASGAKGIFTIPKGATVKIVTSPDGDRFTGVVWDGVEIQVFTQDLKERTVPIECAG